MTEQLAGPPAPAAADYISSLFGLGLKTDELVPAPRRTRLAARPSSVVDALTNFHGAADTLSAVLTDLVLLAALSVTAGAGALWWRLLAPAAVAAVGHVSALYGDRDSVQTRGVLWYPRLLLTPLTAVSLLGLAVHQLTIQQAAVSLAAALATLTAARTLSWVLLVVARRRGSGLRRTLIISDQDSGATVWRRLVEFPESGLVPTQLLSFDQAHRPGAVEREIDRWAIRHVVLVAPTPDDSPLAASLPRHAADAPYYSVVPALAELFVDPRSLTEVGGLPLIPLGRPTRLRQRFPGKRAFDIVASSGLLLVLAPVLAVIAAAIKLHDGGPVLFRQPRNGRGSEVFHIAKFRTMVEGAEAMQHSLVELNVTDGLLFKLRSDPRVTRLGAFLRRTSLDELPQLWNVLRGEMSLVGPRPLVAGAGPVTPAELERLSVQPGITGYWQLSGGNELSYAEMVRLDLAYIRNWSLRLDLKLVLRTIPVLIHRHGPA